jgi:phosphonate transport system permease protein
MTIVNETGPTAVPELPAKPGPSVFAVGTAIGAIVLTIVCARSVGFSLNEIVTNFTRKNSVVEGLLNPDWGQISQARHSAVSGDPMVI